MAPVPRGGITIPEEMANRHYAEHTGKPFFGDLVAFITSGPVVAMEWSGPSAVAVARGLMGATNPLEAAPGTIRAASEAVERARSII